MINTSIITRLQIKYQPSPWLMWLIPCVFGLFQFFLQLSSGVMIGELIHTFPISAFGVASISAAFYGVYILMQVPAGMLLDCFGVRRLLTGGAVVCGIGCLLFAHSHTLLFALLGRMLIGAGACFAFVGELKIVMDWFPPAWFALLLGFAETIGMLGTMLSEVGLAKILAAISWRTVMIDAGFFALCLGALCWLILRDKPQNKPTSAKAAWSDLIQEARLIIKNWTFWANGIYAGILFALVTVFAGFWEIPYLVAAEHITTPMASFISGMLFVGIAVASPLTGYLYPRIRHKEHFLACAALLSCFLVTWMLYFPPLSMIMNALLMFVMGVICTAYIFNFSLMRDVAPAGARTTAFGLTNALCCLSAPLLQTLIGWILDYKSKGTPANDIYIAAHYHGALAILPILLLFAVWLAYQLPTGQPTVDTPPPAS